MGCVNPIFDMFFHITYKMAAQIKLYSIVHGKRKGLASCTNDPIIFVLLHSNM